jgi:hypothetical protein
MTLVRACAQLDYDASTGTCTNEVWLDQPALLPPLSVEEGLLISGAMITVICTAQGLKMLRRYIWKGS